jgi:hypothetical protein
LEGAGEVYTCEKCALCLSDSWCAGLSVVVPTAATPPRTEKAQKKHDEQANAVSPQARLGPHALLN